MTEHQRAEISPDLQDGGFYRDVEQRAVERVHERMLAMRLANIRSALEPASPSAGLFEQSLALLREARDTPGQAVHAVPDESGMLHVVDGEFSIVPSRHSYDLLPPEFEEMMAGAGGWEEGLGSRPSTPTGQLRPPQPYYSSVQPHQFIASPPFNIAPDMSEWTIRDQARANRLRRRMLRNRHDQDSLVEGPPGGMVTWSAEHAEKLDGGGAVQSPDSCHTVSDDAYVPDR